MAPSKSISETEFEVLKALWTQGPGTVREVLAGLLAEGRDWAYTTVQTLLSRLQAKGFVSCDKRDRAHVFRAALTRDEYLSENLGELADKVCGGNTTPLLLRLVEEGRFDREAISRFRLLLDELDPGPADDGQADDQASDQGGPA